MTEVQVEFLDLEDDLADIEADYRDNLADTVDDSFTPVNDIYRWLMPDGAEPDFTEVDWSEFNDKS